MYGEPVATAKLASRAANQGAQGQMDKLLRYVVPPTKDITPKIVGKNLGSRCSTCGRGAEEVSYLMMGGQAAICDRCVIKISQHRRSLEAPENAVCSLCSRTAFEARAMYSYNGVEICKSQPRCSYTSHGPQRQYENIVNKRHFQVLQDFDDVG